MKTVFTPPFFSVVKPFGRLSFSNLRLFVTYPFWVYIFVGEKMGEWALIGGILVLSGSVGRAIIKLKLS